MTAIDFLDTKVKVDFIKPKKTYTESHRLSYCLTALLSLDLADNFRELAERKEILNVAIDYFDRKAEEEFVYLENLAKKQGKEKMYYEDFEVLTETMDIMVKKTLSEFQLKSFPVLGIILKSIYEIKLLTESATHVASAEGKTFNPKMKKLLEFKMRDLKKAFNKYYIKVSNKEFNFNVYDSTFKKLPRSSYSEYVELLKRI